jgi:hypothetical protein
MIFTLISCNSSVESFSREQQKAVNKSIEYIKNSSFRNKERINFSIIKLKQTNENTWEMVHHPDHKIEKNMVDTTDWIITIGDTSYQDFAAVVCDSKTFEVIGFIPIE